MPAESQAQRKWAFAAKGAKWAKAHHFDTPGRLPKKVRKKSTRKSKVSGKKK